MKTENPERKSKQTHALGKGVIRDVGELEV
jgi:hypothetical protein